jgi:predicted nucleic acid-binding Zn ribbon protein
MTADRIKQCPVCKKNKVRRLIGTGAGLIFKGSGFYITDYRSEGYKEKAKAEAGGGTAAKDAKPAASAGTAESKPATPAAKTEAATAATTTPAKPETKPAPAPQAKSSSAKKKSS